MGGSVRIPLIVVVVVVVAACFHAQVATATEVLDGLLADLKQISISKKKFPASYQNTHGCFQK